MLNKFIIIRSSFLAVMMAGSTGISLACEIPEGWMEMKSETPGIEKAALRIPPDTVLLGQPFDIELMTCGSDSTSNRQVKVDATMRAHNHGMNYVPEMTTIGENKYKASGMLFHMPGKWHITLEAQGAEKAEIFELELSVK